MKATLTIAIILLALLRVHGQDHTIKFDLISPLSNKIKIAYESTFSENLSGQITFQSGELATGTFNGSTEYTLSADGIIAEIRGYPLLTSKRAPFGFFIGAAFRYLRYAESFGYSYSVPQISWGKIYNFGLDAGYKFNYRQFCLEVLAGYGAGDIKSNDELRAYRIPDPYLGLVDDEKKFIRAEVSVGFVFPYEKNKGQANSGAKSRRLINLQKDTIKVDSDHYEIDSKASTPSRFSFGLKAGMNINNTSYRNLPDGYKNDNKNPIGFHSGLFLKLKLSERIALIHELQYIKKLANLKCIETPFIVSYSIHKFLNLEAGAFVGFLLESDATDVGSFGEYYSGVTDFGWNGGMRFNLSKRLSIGARYYHGLNDLVSWYDMNGFRTSTEGYNRSIQLSTYFKLTSSH